MYQSDFYEDKGRFADVFNAVLFQGKEVMKPEELETEDSAKTILGILKVKLDLEKIMKKDEEGKEVYDMCQAFEDYKEEGRQAGLEEGRLFGLEEGRIEGEIFMALGNVKNLMKNMKVSYEEAVNILGISKKIQKEIGLLIL